MSTRRRLAQRRESDRADRRTRTAEVRRCTLCRREFAAGTPAAVLDAHRATHPGAPKGEPT